MAEDDPDDRLLLADALAETLIANEIRFVRDGLELMDFLLRRNRYAAPGAAPDPAVVLLDLNLPRMSGLQVLAAMKATASLRRIPVVVLSTSGRPEDVAASYELGASSFFVKPGSYGDLVEMMRLLGRYWLTAASLPELPARLDPEVVSCPRS
jgi:CheY-like chemotaxis protein